MTEPCLSEAIDSIQAAGACRPWRHLVRAEVLRGARRTRQPNMEATVSHMADTSSVGLLAPDRRISHMSDKQEHAEVLLTVTKGKVKHVFVQQGLREGLLSEAEEIS
jgi:hypothetical protein